MNERTAREFAAMGVCEAGRCGYTSVDRQCSGGCLAGVCRIDACEGAECVTPPSPQCIEGGATLRTFEQNGTCRDVGCEYAWVDTPCPWGCEDGQCVDPEGIAELSAGSGYTCGRRRSGIVVCWGSNDTGELGDGTTQTRPLPTPVLDLDDAVEVRAGGSHTCARRSSGSVSCWGWNRSGQLGDGNTAQSEVPVAVVGLVDAVAIAASWHHTCAVRASGQVVCWGANAQGGLGDGTTTGSATPVTVAGLADAVEVTLGSTQIRGGHSCARTGNGSVVCWGYNYHGELGNGSNMDSSVAVGVIGLETALQLGAGRFHSCALTAAGAVSQWGVDWSTALQWNDTPQPLVGLTDVVEIAAGGYHTCARRLSGTVVCWGSNEHGQLGDGTTTNRAAPGAVVALADVAGITAGDRHTCARLNTGGVACWGSNGSGQLGDGTTSDHLTPTTVLGL